MESSKNLTTTGNEQIDSSDENETTSDIAPIFPRNPRKEALRSFPTVYDANISTAITHLVGQGLSLSSISMLPGMPSVYQIIQWSKKHPEFRSALSTAKEARAEILMDSALEIASKSKFSTKDADKIKIDIASKIAAALDPETYGNKTKISGDANAPLSFLISTGITRPGDGLEPIEVKLDKSDPAKLTEKKDHLEEAEVEEKLGPSRGFGTE